MEIIKHLALIVESFSVIEVPTRINATILSIIKYGNRAFIEEIGGLSGGLKWSFKELEIDEKQTEEIRSTIENTFKITADLLSAYTTEDFSHFYNIYQMKPGVVFALYWEFVSYSQVQTEKGMDDKIADFFFVKNKPVVCVESRRDVINALSLATVTVEDIKDDFLSPDIRGYLSSLPAMHAAFLRHNNEKRLMNTTAISIRNRSWIEKYEGLTKTNGRCVAIHGQHHFPGSQGLIQLGQEKGWKWSFFQPDGSYKPFTYFPESPEAFKFD